MSGAETDTKLHDKDFVDTITIDLLDAAHVSDADGDNLTVSNIQVNGQPLPSYITLDADGHTLIVDLNSPDLDPILKDALHTDSITYTIEDDNGGSATNTVTLDITGTADLYSKVVSLDEPYVKTAVSQSGNGQETAQTFQFNLPVDDGGFDFSGTVTLTVNGDIDANNENAVVLDGGELLFLQISGGGNPSGVDKVDDGYLTDNVTVSGFSDVAAGGFDDGVVTFDVTVSGQVANGTEITGTLNYDFWM